MTQIKTDHPLAAPALRLSSATTGTGDVRLPDAGSPDAGFVLVRSELFYRMLEALHREQADPYSVTSLLDRIDIER